MHFYAPKKEENLINLSFTDTIYNVLDKLNIYKQVKSLKDSNLPVR